MGAALASIALEGCPQEDLEDRKRLRETALLLLISVLSSSGYFSLGFDFGYFKDSFSEYCTCALVLIDWDRSNGGDGAFLFWNERAANLCPTAGSIKDVLMLLIHLIL